MCLVVLVHCSYFYHTNSIPCLVCYLASIMLFYRVMLLINLNSHSLLKFMLPPPLLVALGFMHACNVSQENNSASTREITLLMKECAFGNT